MGVGRETGRGVLWIALAFAALVRARSAGAQCSVRPGEQGEVATWLVAGPVATAQVRPPRPVDDQLRVSLPAVGDGTGARPQSGAPLAAGSTLRWTPWASADARLDLDGALHGRGPRTGFAGVELVTTRAVNVQLFLGSDDGLAVMLDGREVYRRGGVRDARDDDDRVPLALAPGRHALVVKLYVNGGAMRLYARLVGEDFLPTPDVQVALPGVDAAACARLAADALRIEPRRAVQAAGVRLAVTASYPGGTAVRDGETARALRLAVAGVPALVTANLSLAPGPGIAPAALEVLAPDTATSASLEALDAVDGAARQVADLSLAMAPPVRRALRRAEGALPGFDERAPPAWLPRASLTSVRFVAERLAGLVSDGDHDGAHLLDEARTLESLLDAVDAHRDPYAGRTGALRRGYRSPVDDTLQGYSVYVPPSYRGDRAFPVVVALHGLAGSAHRMLPVLFGLYDEHESRTHAERYIPPLPDTRAILVAPYGFGDTGYRALGEADVMAVLDEVRASYRTDPDRTYMTGLSMGGIGAGAIPLHFPDVFAATAPLCGYHSYFVRSDTQGVRRPWETFLMESRSNALWAENGLHLPLYVVHGTRDRPVENSRVLVDRYAQLGYRVESEWPDLGHNVWSTTYANGRIVPYFLQFRRDAAPRRVRFRSPGLRWRRSYWLELDALERPGAWGEVDAAVSAAGLRVTTQGVAALTLAPPASLFPRADGLTVTIDGDSVPFTPGAPLSLARNGGRWFVATARQCDTVRGPVRDVFDGPIAVVYGTRVAAERPMNERVARAWARMRPGVRVHLPVLADTAVTDAFARAHTLVLVGTPAGNAYLGRIAARLPIRVERGAIVAGTERFAGAEVGATFVADNPEAPGRLVVVVIGAGPLGVWRSRFLPDLVPDAIVYDEAVANARGRVLLGPRAHALAAGYLDRRGALAGLVRDPLAAPQPGPPDSVPAAPEREPQSAPGEQDEQR